MLRRTFLLTLFAALVMFGSGVTVRAQGWTFTETVTHTGPGPCIPYPMLPPMVYYTRDACEYNRNNELSKNGEDWSADMDGSCILVITCTPCVGSDIGTGADGSGGSSFMGDPGDLNIAGLLTGNALFSPHDTRDIETWINDFLQRNRSMGISDAGMNQITSGDVPLTGNAGFDKFYTEQMMRFQKPEQGGTVYLEEGQNTIDPNDLKNTALAASVPVLKGGPMSPEMQYGQKYADRADLFMDSENGAIDERLNLDPYIDFGRSAAVFGVGFLKKGAIPAIVIVDILVEDIKHGVQLFRNMYMGENEPIPETGTILWNTAENITTDVLSAFVGNQMGKVAVAATVKHAEGVLVSKGVLPGIAKISEKPKNIAESVNTGVSVMTGSIDLVDSWGEAQKKLQNPGK